MDIVKNDANIIIKFFSAKYMLKQHQIIGDIPSTKQLYGNVLAMSWPSVIEAVLISLISSVDTIMVSSLGSGAIAAVGITNQPKFVLLATIISLNVGVTAVIARRKGAKDSVGANNCLKQGIMLSVILSAFLSAAGYGFAQPILKFAGANESYIADAVTYFRIIVLGNFFYSIGLTITAAQRGAGNTKISMRTNLAANLVNLVFNYLLINGILFFPALGIKGAAIATALGNFVSFVMAVYSVLKRGEFLSIISSSAGWHFDKTTLSGVLNVSSSAFVEQVFMRIGFFSYAKMVAALGTLEFATHQICMNILNLSFAFGDGISIAASSLVGQSLGAKRPDIAIIYGKTAQRIAFCVSSVLFFVFLLGRYFWVSLFTDDANIIALGAPLLIIIAFITHLQTSQVLLTGCLRGAGDTFFVAIVSLVSVTIIRPFFAWLFCFYFGFGLVGAWSSLFFDQGIRFAANFIRFSGGNWTKKKLG